MPKEGTWSKSGPFAVGPKGGEHPVSDLPEGDGQTVYQRAVVVRWTKSQAPRSDYLEVGVAKVRTADNFEVDAHYLDLDRAGVNRLIRSLRKARDDAFGRDE